MCIVHSVLTEGYLAPYSILIYLLFFIPEQQLYVELLEKAPFEYIKDLVHSTNCSLGFKLHFYDSFRKWQTGLRSLSSSSSELIAGEPSPSSIKQPEPSHPTYTNKHDPENVLGSIFKSAPKEASQIQEYFKEHQSLNGCMRDELMKIIARHFVTNKMTFSSKTCRKISMQIVEAFPSEKGVSIVFLMSHSTVFCISFSYARILSVHLERLHLSS